MRVLLIGLVGSARRDALEAAARAEGHDVRCASKVSAAQAAWQEAAAPLVLLAAAEADVLALCQVWREGDDAPVVLAVAPSGAEAQRALADDAPVDELIFACTPPHQLRAQLALAGRRAARRSPAESPSLSSGREPLQQALRESEAKARAVLDTTVDGIITIDDEGRIESFNQAAEAIFGYAAADVVGQNISVLMPEPYRSEHDTYLRSYHETGRRKIIGIGREVEGRRKDGTTFPLDLAVSEVHLGERRLFTGVVRDISERRRLEREILEVSEEERRRIGQDLHDNLGQMLTGVGLLSRSLARKLRQAGAPGADEAATIEQFIREADEQARGLARGLVPVDLEAKGLADALQRLTDHTEALFDVRCVFRETASAAVHDNTAATHLYRIAQEAVHNAVKHGQAARITVMLAAGAERTRLRVKDDGVGFPENNAAVHESQAGGMGVRIMHHRARMIGATLEIQSAPGEGAAVTCTLRTDRRGAPRCPVR